MQNGSRPQSDDRKAKINIFVHPPVGMKITDTASRVEAHLQLAGMSRVPLAGNIDGRWQ
jgi:hypothetical protein